jgi:phage-related protein
MSKSSGLEENTSAQSNLTCTFEKSVEAANTTLKHLATAKETFSDFGASYKQFLVELNEIREDHRLEV